MILCTGITTPVSMIESQDIFFHAPAGLKLNLILRGHGFTAKLSTLARVPGSRSGQAIDRFAIRCNARYQPVFARRDVDERGQWDRQRRDEKNEEENAATPAITEHAEI